MSGQSKRREARSGIRRMLPHPKLFLCLLAMWLLLNQSISPGHLVLGTLVAFGASWAMVALDPVPIRIRKPRAVLRLVAHVLVDVFRSNLAVGKIILGLGRRDQRSGFMTVPLDLRDRYGLTALSVVLTATPGTLWMHYDASSGMLLLHVLDLVDEEEWVRTIKDRYERLLIEIFE